MADTVTGGGTNRNASGHSYMAPELRVERARSRLVLEELTNLFDGGPVMTEMKKKFSEQLPNYNFLTIRSLPSIQILTSIIHSCN